MTPSTPPNSPPPSNHALAYLLGACAIMIVIVTSLLAPAPKMANVFQGNNPSDIMEHSMQDGQRPGYVPVLWTQTNPIMDRAQASPPPPYTYTNSFSTLDACMHTPGTYCYLDSSIFQDALAISFGHYTDLLHDHPGTPIWITNGHDGTITVGFVQIPNDPTIYRINKDQFPNVKLEYYFNDHGIHPYHIGGRGGQDDLSSGEKAVAHGIGFLGTLLL